MIAAPSAALPDLRADLALLDGASAMQGARRWLIHDPLQQRYIQIEETAHRLLTLWPTCRTVADLVKAALERFQLQVDPAEIEAFAGFLKANHLTVSKADEQDWRRLFAMGQQQRTLIGQALHGYLFFRIPLFRPDRFLKATYPAVAFLFNLATVSVFLLLGILGLYLVSRQWEAFSSTFDYLFSPAGFIAFGVTLVLVKACHELAHAYMAVRFGCYVPTIGIAFVVLAPMPYTDVTDAWKLKDRRQRLMIDSAGMLVEIMIAAMATFLWAFLPDGPARSMAFMLATVGWLMSLAVNLNPFMRFDGYYLFSELMGIENLQTRAFALGRWRLREVLFGLGLARPERLPRRIETLLVVYAWMTWMYRLVLFLGIAIFVYNYFFKALGIALFVVEIVYFIAVPIASEFAVWRRLRRQIQKSWRGRVTMALVGCGLIALFLPLSTTIQVPAVLERAETASVYPPGTAVIDKIEVVQGAEVVAGQVLVRLRSPQLEQTVELTRIKLDLVRMRLARRAGDATDRQDSLVLQNERNALENRLDGLTREIDQLTVTAPITGTVLELNSGLHEGRWIGAREMLALLGNREKSGARGYLAEKGLGRIKVGAKATFIPEMPTRRKVELVLEQVALADVTALDLPELSSTFGGPVPAKPDSQQRQIPTSGQYLAVFRAPDQQAGATVPERAVRGLIHVEASGENLASAIVRQILKVLVREAGA